MLLEIKAQPFSGIMVAFPKLQAKFAESFDKNKYTDIVAIEGARKMSALLGSGGYVAQLHNLRGPLAQYNKTIVKPKLASGMRGSGEEMYEVKLNNGTCLVLPASKLKIGVDRGRVRRSSFQADKANKPIATNRSSAKEVMNYLSKHLIYFSYSLGIAHLLSTQQAPKFAQPLIEQRHRKAGTLLMFLIHLTLTTTAIYPKKKCLPGVKLSEYT